MSSGQEATRGGGRRSKDARTGATFRRELRERLGDFTDDARASLSRLFARPLQKGATRVDFEVHFYALDRGVPIVGYAMDEADAQRGGPLVPFRKKLFSRRELRAYEEAGVETLEIGALVVRAWFKEVWRDAGGADWRHAGRLSLHDDDERVDLRRVRPRPKGRPRG